ncbi:MAG: hypothetical protein K6G87_08155 [Butyrivibrio sp.]|uniref:hypothetical protein n=1 Tax=Butyrivibrio sp. TaxID=28121 RepID=UPI0025E6F00C|nr:hypothetical protein [Butyrivibrio sp.]MCR5771185.1 hypothetical protein [Butyrivibrio sp.]
MANDKEIKKADNNTEPVKDNPVETDNSLDVGGFLFKTKEDADKARVDARKIEYLESHVKLNSLANIKTVYTKSIQNKVFGTPLGWSFLSFLRRQVMIQGGDLSDMPNIELKHIYTHTTSPDDYVPKEIVKEKPKKKTNHNFLKYSLFVNIFLVILVICMFLIAASNNSTTVLNYKETITDEYEAWEEELTEREKAVKEKEKELGIESKPDFNTSSQSQ